jgi:hypothetical protein
MDVAVGLRRNMGLGIMNIDMNVYTNAVGDMTSGTSSPYGELSGTMFNVQSYLSPPHALMSHDVRSAVVAAGATSVSSTRPIAIPLPNHHFRSAPQFALSPSVHSSPPERPWSAYYYSASPATSASSMSIQSDDFGYRAFKPVNSSQPIPVSPSPSSPESLSSPTSADKAPVMDSPSLHVQRVRRKK